MFVCPKYDDLKKWNPKFKPSKNAIHFVKYKNKDKPNT